VLFFAWSTDHWKILAYVPFLDRAVAPLGYRSGFALAAHVDWTSDAQRKPAGIERRLNLILGLNA